MNSFETNIPDQEWNRQKMYKIIGVSFATMFFLGIFAEFAVRVQLINWENPKLTFANIQESLLMFDAGIFSFIVVIILDVLLSISLYTLFSSVYKPIALLMVSLRLVYVAVKGFAIVGLFLARDIYSYSVVKNADHMDMYAAQGMQYLKMHHYGFGVGLIFFGLHLIFLAILLFKGYRFPKPIVWMLLAAGTGYIMNSLVSFFATDFNLLKNITIAIFIIPMTFSELSFGTWLWVKRGNAIPLWKK